MDKIFLGIQDVMAKQNGPESTRYCGGCHDPISLFSGTKNIFVENLTGLHGYQEGVSCLACHAIRETDIKGNANYTVTQPGEYLWQWATNGVGRFARDFLIRSYPAEHNKLAKRSFKKPEHCAACHKQFIDAEVNRVGWVQLQNQYDNWAASHWNKKGDAQKTVECRECHMPLVESRDPSSGDALDYNRTPADRKHRSHRFNDGWLDLYVANDVSDNVFYRNVGGRFEDISHAAWVADYRSAMGLVAGDFDRDGDPDMHVTHWVAQENALYENLRADLNTRRTPTNHVTQPAGPAMPSAGAATTNPPPAVRFVDIADQKGLGQIALPFVGWGTDFVDLDQDGWLDLLVVNGSTIEADGPPPKRLQPQEAFVFWNQNGRYFHNLAPPHPELSQKHVSPGVGLR